MAVLIVCRVEHSAKVPAWMKELGDAATFACSSYGDVPEPGIHNFPGGKWIGIVDFLNQNPELLAAHDYFWFPDDDIVTTSDVARSFLSMCVAEQFELAQPALLPDSYFAYQATIANPRFCFRRTNLIELMMPFMRKDFLLKVIPLLEGKHAALGVDWIWNLTASEPYDKVAILDQYPMLHSRPRNQFLASKMRKKNIDLEKERRMTFDLHNIKPIIPLTYSGRLRNGLDARNRFVLAFEVLRGYFMNRHSLTNGKWSLKHAMLIVWRQLGAGIKTP